jgi:hypothetical protein
VLDSTPYLAGPVCPVPAAGGSYTVTVRLVYDTAPAADATRWGGIYFAVATDDCPDDVDPSTGYLAALRWNGTLELFAQPAGRTGMVSRASTPTSPIVAPVLSAALPPGRAVTSLPVRAVPAPLERGHRFVLPTGQVAALDDAAPCGATSLSIDALVPSAEVAPGTVLGQEVTLTIAKTPTRCTVRRTDDGPAVSCTDATWSGGYLFLRNSGDGVAAVSCSSLTVS